MLSHVLPVLWASSTVSSLPPNELKVASLADIPQCSPLTVPLWMSRALTFMVIATARAALSSLFVPHYPLPTSTLLQDDGDGRERERDRERGTRRAQVLWVSATEAPKRTIKPALHLCFWISISTTGTLWSLRSPKVWLTEYSF